MEQNTKMSIYYDLRSLEERFDVRLVDRINDEIIVQGGLKVSEMEKSSTRSVYFKLRAIELEHNIKLLSKINTDAYVVIGGLLRDKGTVLSDKFTNHKMDPDNYFEKFVNPFTKEKPVSYERHTNKITNRDSSARKMYETSPNNKKLCDSLFYTKDDLISYIYEMCIKNYDGLYEKTGTVPKDLPVLDGASVSSSGQLLNKSILLPHDQLEHLVNHPMTNPKYDYYRDITERTGVPFDQAIFSYEQGNRSLVSNYIDKYKNYPTLSQLVYAAYITKGLLIDNVGKWDRDSIGDFIRFNKKRYYDKFASIDHMHHFRGWLKMTVMYTRIKPNNRRVYRFTSNFSFKTMEVALRKAASDYRSSITPFRIIDETGISYGTQEILSMCKKRGLIR